MPRLAIKAAIKRASAVARENANQLDECALEELLKIYEAAARDLGLRIDQYAGVEGAIRLQSLRALLDDIEVTLSELSQRQAEALARSMEEGARLGVAPMREYLGDAVSSSLVSGAVAASVAFIAADGLQLSDRLWRVDSSARESIRNAINQAVIQGHSASQTAQDFLGKGRPVPVEIMRKRDRSQVSVIKSEAVSALITDDASAYHNARRVFRTEINRAHGTAYQASVFEHSEVVGTRFLLSPAHPDVDICDMHAKINRYGLGVGVYPPGKSPWPAHPNTLSYEEAVFGDEVSEEDRASKISPLDWIKMQTTDRQIAVLGGRRKQAALAEGRLREGEIKTPWRVLKKKYGQK